MLGFPVALLTVNAFEWYAHKNWLHEYACKHRDSPFFSHIRHHKQVRVNQFKDASYTQSLLENQEIYFEQMMLVSLCAVFTPVAPVAPFFTLGIYYGAWQYWSKHSKAHLDPQWAKEHLPWHYDHHMNTNQNANWCVTRPWFDYVMGTRIIGDANLAESNVFGVKLPAWLDLPLNKTSRKLFPKVFDQLDVNRQREKLRRDINVVLAIDAA